MTTMKMYSLFLLFLVASKVHCQINALASVLEFADSGEFENHPTVLERPEESKCEIVSSTNLMIQEKWFFSPITTFMFLLSHLS